MYRLVFILPILFVLSCDNDHYKSYSGSLKYRLHAFGNDVELQHTNYSVVKFYPDKGKPFTEVLDLSVPSPLNEFLKTCYLGDSITLFLTDTLLFGNREVKFKIKVVDIFSQEEFDNLRSEEKEKYLIRKLTKNYDFNDQKLNWKIGLLEYNPSGDTTKVVCGREIALRYEGSLINGLTFDSNMQDTLPLEFPFCSDNQVLIGIEKAIDQKFLNDKLKIIIPSQLAFGKNGSVNQIVPPYEPVIYQLKITNVYVQKNEIN